ncbi:MAG: hypothetical protein ACP5I8_07380, partial [Phycisphaerae bacterium]
MFRTARRHGLHLPRRGGPDSRQTARLLPPPDWSSTNHRTPDRPASIFMGDTGSMFLGYVCGAMIIMF